jgi:hypothetical protein
MIELKKIFPLIIVCLLSFLSCEEPDDPALAYEASVTKSIGKTITSIDVFWEQAALDNFDRYEIYFKKYYETDYKLYLSVTNQNQLYATISNLTPETEYNIYVNTFDKNGKSYSSEVINVKTFSDIPSEISSIDITDYSYNYVILRWTKYQDSYAVPFDRYELYKGTTYDFTCNDSSRILVINSMDIYEATIWSLTDKTGYYFKARVYNTLGKYRESASIYLRTLNAPPAAVELLPAENITVSSATIRWKKSHDTEFQKYTVHVGTDYQFKPTTKNLVTTITNVNDTVIQVSGLKTGNPYFYKVLVYDTYLDYSISNYAGFHAYQDGLPPVCEVMSLDYPEVKPDQITVAWEQSGVIFFSRYDIYMSTDSSALVANKGLANTLTGDREVTYCTFKDLKEGKYYYFKVAVVDFFGKQSHSKIKGVYLP